jgi:hypothetical protein
MTTMTGFGVPFPVNSGNKRVSREFDKTSHALMEIKGNLRILKDFKGINVTLIIFFCNKLK